MLLMVKTTINIVGANYFKQWDGTTCFAVQYDDGITITYEHVNDEFKLFSLLSTGLSSTYLTTGKWPTKRSISARSVLAKDWFNKNKKRYKLLKK